MIWYAALTLLALAAPAVARTHAPAVPAAALDPARLAAALELAKVTNSEAFVVGDASGDDQLAHLLPQMIEGNEEIGALEKQYPGFTIQYAQALVEITRRSWRERLPELWNRQAALHAAHFSVPELSTLKSFFGGRTGQKMIAMAQRRMKPIRILMQASASPNSKLASKAAGADEEAIAPVSMDAFDEADKAAAEGLARTGLLPLMRKIAPQTGQIAQAWMREMAPWEAAEIAKALAATINVMKTKAQTK